MAVSKHRSSVDRGISPVLSDEERRAQRRVLAAAEVDALAAASLEERRRYFLDETIGQEEAWTAFAADGGIDGWHDTRNGVDIIPVWPHSGMCETVATVLGKDWTEVPIPLTDWIDQLFPSISEASNHLAICPMPGADHKVLSPDELADSWERHWRSFAKSLVARTSTGPASS